MLLELIKMKIFLSLVLKQFCTEQCKWDPIAYWTHMLHYT